MSVIENFMPRRRPRAADQPPIAGELVHWSKDPRVVAAAEVRREAVAKVDRLAGELAEWQDKVKRVDEQIGATGIGAAELEEAEEKVRIVDKELRWARYAVARAGGELTAAREAAQLDLAAVGLRVVGTDQQRIYELMCLLHDANMQLFAHIREGEAAGLNFGRLFDQHCPGIDGDLLKAWKKNARWLPGAGPVGPNLKTHAEVVVRRTGGPPLQGVQVGESCWIPKADIPRLLKAQRIEVVGTPDGVFVPPPAPAPDGLGDVEVRFTQQWVTQLAGGAWRQWREGEIARVNHKIAWEAVVDQAAEYDARLDA
jgi:hypothetical protein